MVLKGARRVGKTWLMKEFGKNYYKSFVYFNFDEEDPHGTLEKIKAELHNRYPDYTQFAIVDTDFSN